MKFKTILCTGLMAALPLMGCGSDDKPKPKNEEVIMQDGGDGQDGYQDGGDILDAGVTYDDGGTIQDDYQDAGVTPDDGGDVLGDYQDGDVSQDGETTPDEGERPSIVGGVVVTYNVTGSTCEEAGEDIFGEDGKGFLEDGQRYGGQTNCAFDYSMNWRGIPGESEPRKYCCKAVPSGLAVTCDITVTLPEWDGNDPCWDEYIDALTVHEQGHVDICLNALDGLDERLNAHEGEACSSVSMQDACNRAAEDLEQKIQADFNAFLNEVSDLHDHYDDNTNHGEDQGAVLDCDCE